MTPSEILRRPYHRCIKPDGDAWFGEILEFPGCFAVGGTPGETATNLESTAESWLMAVAAQNQTVPEPFDDFQSAVRMMRRATERT
jgi:predicted RNase H-like HicB family nuclease